MRIVSVKGLYLLEGGDEQTKAAIAKGAGFRLHRPGCGAGCKACASGMPFDFYFTSSTTDVARAVYLAHQRKIEVEIGDEKLAAAVKVQVELREAQATVEDDRVVEMKVRVKLKPGCPETAKMVGATVAKRLQQAFPAKLKAELDYDSLAVLEHREVKLPEEFVSLRGLLGVDRLPADTARVMRQAIAKAKKTEPDRLAASDGWLILEYICADYLGGPGEIPAPEEG